MSEKKKVTTEPTAAERIEILKAAVANELDAVGDRSIESQKVIADLNSQIGLLVPKAIEEQNLADFTGLKTDQASIEKMNKALEQATKRRIDAIKRRDDAIASANDRRVRLAKSLGVPPEGILGPITSGKTDEDPNAQKLQSALDLSETENVALKNKIEQLEEQLARSKEPGPQVPTVPAPAPVVVADSEQLADHVRMAVLDATERYLGPAIDKKNWTLVGDYVKVIKGIVTN